MDEDKQQLLENQASLDRTTNHIQTIHKIALETEETGKDILIQLGTQRKTIERSKARLINTDASLTKSNNILNKMMNLSRKQKVVSFLTAVLCVVVIVIIVVLKIQ